MSGINTYSLRAMLEARREKWRAQVEEKLKGLLNARVRLNDCCLTTLQRRSTVKSVYESRLSQHTETFILQAGESSLNLSESPALQMKIQAVEALSLFEAVSEAEPILRVAQARESERFQKVSSAMANLKRLLDERKPITEAIHQDVLASSATLKDLSLKSHSLLASVEENLLLEEVSQSLSDLNYRLEQRGGLLVASKGTHLARVKVHHGRIALDTTSFPGISCHAEMNRIEEDLKRRGLVLERLSGKPFDPPGAVQQREANLFDFCESGLPKNAENMHRAGTVLNKERHQCSEVAGFTTNPNFIRNRLAVASRLKLKEVIR